MRYKNLSSLLCRTAILRQTLINIVIIAFSSFSLISKSNGICDPPDPFPSQPGADRVTMNVSDLGNETTTIHIWDYHCPGEGNTGYRFLRAVPTNGTPLLCGGDFSVLQNGRQFDSLKLADEADSSFCGKLFIAKTFMLTQYSFLEPFNLSGSFVLIYDGYPDDSRVTVPAFTAKMTSRPVVSGPPDMNGDGMDDIVIRRGNKFFIDLGGDGKFAEQVLTYGAPNEVVFTADMDGDGRDDLVIRRGNKFLIDFGHNGVKPERVINYGTANDKVFPADMDGDGRDELVIQRGNRFYVDLGHNGGRAEVVFSYGSPTDTLLPGFGSQ